MNFWNLNSVPPSKLRELKEASTSYSDSKAFFDDRIRKVNDTIYKLKDEGRKKCCPDYNIVDFELSYDGVEYTISHQGSKRRCDFELVAFAEWYTEHVIQVEHKRTVKAYEDYDKNENDFLHLEDRINAVGGKIIFKRPFIDLVLPAVDSLAMVTYPNLVCNFRNYSVLEKTLTALLDEKLENQFH